VTGNNLVLHKVVGKATYHKQLSRNTKWHYARYTMCDT